MLGVGLALALGSGATVEYALRRRLIAEGLARDNGRLYREQQNIAGYLQHALLPRVPEIDGVEIAARYLAGVVDIDVGGDWYDVISTGVDRCVFFVGDVSGRGLQAATTMASLRYAIRAYTAQGDDVATVLVKLGALLDIEADQQFATVLAGEIDVGRHSVTVVSAGHFMPLVVSDGAADLHRRCGRTARRRGPAGPTDYGHRRRPAQCDADRVHRRSDRTQGRRVDRHRSRTPSHCGDRSDRIPDRTRRRAGRTS